MKSRILVCLAVFFSAFCCEAQSKKEEDYIIEKDPTIECEFLTDQREKAIKCENFDPGFAKYLLTFKEIPGSPPYCLLQKRIAQKDEKAFASFGTPINGVEILKAKKANRFYQVFVSARGYLPGEKITLRLASKEKGEFKEITFCPRPLILRKKSGEILAKVELGPSPQIYTFYNIDVLGVKEEEKFTFTSHSAHEKIEHEVTGPAFMNLHPAVVGMTGGIDQFELKLEDGSVHTLALPWGLEMIQYLNGKK